MTLNFKNLIWPLLIIGPFLNILARHNIFEIVVVVSLISLFILFNIKSYFIKKYIDKLSLILIGLIIFSIISSIIYHFYKIGMDTKEGAFLDYALFYSTLFILILFWVGTYLCGSNINDKFIVYAKYFFWISFINIIWGGVVLYFDFPRSWELMQHDNYKDGSGRPFGLTGNAAVNGATLAMVYLMIARGEERKGSLFCVKYLLMLTIGIVVQKSGTGLAVYFLVLIYQTRMYSKKLFYSLAAAFPYIYLVFYLMPESLLFYRISPRYIVYNYNYYHGNVVKFFDLNLSVLDVFFGKAVALGDKVITSDFGPLFMFNQMGLFYFVFLTIFLLRLTFLSDVKADKYIILIVFLAGIHYQAIFFLSTSFLFSLYVVNLMASKKV